MAINDIQSGYWCGPRGNNNSPTVRADKISKTAWMDLYYDLFQQVYGENVANEFTVIQDAENRLKVLKQNGIRR